MNNTYIIYIWYNVSLRRPLQEDPALGGPFNRLVLQATDSAALAWLEEEKNESVDDSRDIQPDPLHTSNTTWHDNQMQNKLLGQDYDPTIPSPLTDSPRPRENVIITTTNTTTGHTPLYPASYTHPTHTAHPEHALSTEEVLIRREEQRALRDLYDGHRYETDSTVHNSGQPAGLSPRMTPGTCKRKLSFTSGYPTPSTTSSSPHALTESGAQLAAQRVRRSVVISSFPKYTPQLLSVGHYSSGNGNSSSEVYNGIDIMRQDFDEEGQGEEGKANGV